MERDLGAVELCEGLDEGEVLCLAKIARPRSLLAQEYLFLLGETADCLYVVKSGRMDLCFPLSFGGVIRDVSIEAISPGRALGWSSLVKPYRFTLSARAAEPTQLTCFPRRDLLEVFQGSPRIGYIFLRHLAEVIGNRHLNLQALWARELQRAVAGDFGRALSRGPAASAKEGGGNP